MSDDVPEQEGYEPEHKYNVQECDGYWIVVLDGEYEPAIDETYFCEKAAIEACDQADDLAPLDCPHCRDLYLPTVEADSDGFQDSYGCNACGMRGPATSVDPAGRRAHVACGSWNQLVRALEGDERIRQKTVKVQHD